MWPLEKKIISVCTSTLYMLTIDPDNSYNYSTGSSLLQIHKFLHEEVMLSIHRDYNPEFENTENGGVVAIVDNIQTSVSYEV